MKPRERIGYSAIVDRTPLKLPDGARLVVWPIVVEDCVDTMDGPELHDAALLCIRTALGWVMTSEHVVQSLLEGNR